MRKIIKDENIPKEEKKSVLKSICKWVLDLSRRETIKNISIIEFSSLNFINSLSLFDVSKLDAANIKVYNNKYNVKNILKEIYQRNF